MLANLTLIIGNTLSLRSGRQAQNEKSVIGGAIIGKRHEGTGGTEGGVSGHPATIEDLGGSRVVEIGIGVAG